MNSISHLFRLKTPCALCQRPHAGKYAVCNFCKHTLMPLGIACPHCATPLLNTQRTHTQRCGYCIKQKPPIDHVFTNYRFEEPLRTLLHRFKYHDAIHLKAFIASLMLQSKHHIIQSKTECLIPVPTHPKRLQQRGFNHAALLARALSKKIHIPCRLNLVQKIKDTPSQAQLDALARRKNLKNTFRIKPMPYQHVTLIDDLITTGSTANALALQLKTQGVTRVDLWCVAKTCLI